MVKGYESVAHWRVFQNGWLWEILTLRISEKCSVMLQIRKIIIKIVIKYLFSLERKYQMLANMWGGRILMGVYIIWASLVAQMVVCLQCRRPGLIPGSERSPGEGNGKPLHYSCLENPMNRGPWQAIVLGVTQCQTRLKWLSTHAVHWYTGKLSG